MRVKLENSCGLLIDFQEKLLPVIDGAEAIIERTRVLISGLKALGLPLIVTEQYPKGIGRTVAEIEELASGASRFEKLSFSCADTDEIFKAIKATGRKNVIICGVEAHVCVLQTVIDLADAGFSPVWVDDCIGSRKANDKKIARKRAIAEGAIVTTAEAILFELTRKAGSDVFKTISKLVK